MVSYLGRGVSYSSLTSILLLLLDHDDDGGEEGEGGEGRGGSSWHQKFKAATNNSESCNHGRTDSDWVPWGSLIWSWGLRFRLWAVYIRTPVRRYHARGGLLTYTGGILGRRNYSPYFVRLTAQPDYCEDYDTAEIWTDHQIFTPLITHHLSAAERRDHSMSLNALWGVIFNSFIILAVLPQHFLLPLFAQGRTSG